MPRQSYEAAFRFAEAEKWEYRFLNGCYISGYEERSEGVFVWSNSISDSWLNHVRLVKVTRHDIPDLINQADQFFSPRHRNPAFHVTPFSRPTELGSILTAMGFVEGEKLSWMFFAQQPSLSAFPNDLPISRVSSVVDAHTFVDLFREAHLGPGNPELPAEYGDDLLGFIKHPPPGHEAFHYLAWMDLEPVGYASLHTCGSVFAGIYNVGTIPSARRRGVASALIRRAIADATIQGATCVYLVSDHLDNERLYKKLGFETQFVSAVYSRT